MEILVGQTKYTDTEDVCVYYKLDNGNTLQVKLNAEAMFLDEMKGDGASGEVIDSRYTYVNEIME